MMLELRQGNLLFGGIDEDHEIKIEIGDQEEFINQGQAIEIIAHLQKEFNLNGDL